MSYQKTLLHVNSSGRITRSLSRRLGRLFTDRWLALRPMDRIVHRDVGLVPPPFVSEAWIAAAFSAPEERTPEMEEVLAASNELIDEVQQADIIILGAPMYNYGMPAALKAWFDQVARIGRSFSFDLSRGDFPIEPVFSGKHLVVLSARGEFGFAPGGVRAQMNALDPGIAACAHYIGVAREDIHTIVIEYQEFKDERYHASVAGAEAAVIHLAKRLTDRVEQV